MGQTVGSAGHGDRPGSEGSEPEAEQLALLRTPAPRRHRAARAAEPPAEKDPVAVVQVDTGLAHLDRPFEYTVPVALADAAQPGVRVKVRFAGKDRDGFVLARRADAEHEGRLAPLRRVVSPEPVLTPSVLAAARSVADRYAGTLGDVLRLAVPPRHATAERNLPPEPLGPAPAREGGREAAAWAAYPAGASFLTRVTGGQSPAAALLALPATDRVHDWPRLLAEAAAAAHSGGRGALLVVPDHRDVTRVDAALTEVLGDGRHVRLTADQGPQARYTAFLSLLRGHVRVVVGTRAAAFAPVRELGLVVWWDDGDDLHEEPRAPYPHIREILLARARVEAAAVLVAGYARSAALEQLLETGLLKPIDPPRSALRSAAPRVRVAGEGGEAERDPAAALAHLPSTGWRVAKEALASGPVLVQVPRRGYLPALSCQDCRRPARCPHCGGPLGLARADVAPACRWCGREPAGFSCPACGSHRFRSSVVGARRTAEELGRAFPGVPVQTSGSGAVLDAVPASPRLVIATPGAEPVAEGGYAAALLLDAWALLDRPVLTAGEEALRRWLGAAALVRGAADGGVVVLAGAPVHATIPAVEALVRWDPGWFAARELEERRGLRLPPTVAMASVTGPRRAVEATVSGAGLDDAVEVLGPLPLAEEGARLLLRVDLAHGPALAEALAEAKAVRSARKEPEGITVRLDPPDPSL
jgi:primosomal protein N' (replication factor Y)